MHWSHEKTFKIAEPNALTMFLQPWSKYYENF